MAKEEKQTAAEQATESLEKAPKDQPSQKQAEDKARKDLKPVEEFGMAPSKSTGQLVPDTQTGVMTAQAVDPKDFKATGKVKVILEGGAANDGKKQEFEADFYGNSDLTDVFNSVRSQFEAAADEMSRAQTSKTARAAGNTTGVTQDNYKNTPESKGRSGEVFLTDADALKAEVDAQNEERAKSKKSEKKD